MFKHIKILVYANNNFFNLTIKKIKKLQKY